MSMLLPACLLLGCAVTRAQEWPIPPQVAPGPPFAGENAAPAMYPEQGFLSPHRYTSACFGFSIDFPPGETMHRLHSRILPSGEHYLLAVEFGGADRTSRIVIRAQREESDSAEKEARAQSAELRKQETNWGFVARRKLGLLTAWRFENGTSSYVFQHTVLWYADVPGCTPGSRYLLQLSTDSSEPSFDARLQKAMESLQRFDAKANDDAAREQAGADAVPYTGPALPTDLVDATIAADPARKIDPGEWKGNNYANATAGVIFEAPAAFRVLPVSEAGRILALAQDPKLGGRRPDRRHELWRACSRTLAVVEDVEHPMVADVAPAAVLTLTRRDCVPDMQPPEDMNDHDEVEAFAELLARSTQMTGLHKGIVGEHASRRLFALEGTTPFHREGDEFAHRLSMRLTATAVGNDYLLTLFAVAENDDALRHLEEAVKLGGAAAR